MKLVYKVGINHSHIPPAGRKGNQYLSVKLYCLKGVIFLINIHKTSWNNRLLLSIFDKAYFEQESVFEETK